jgi:hypothetical protein
LQVRSAFPAIDNHSPSKRLPDGSKRVRVPYLLSGEVKLKEITLCVFLKHIVFRVDFSSHSILYIFRVLHEHHFFECENLTYNLISFLLCSPLNLKKSEEGSREFHVMCLWTDFPWSLFSFFFMVMKVGWNLFYCIHMCNILYVI